MLSDILCHVYVILNAKPGEFPMGMASSFFFTGAGYGLICNATYSLVALQYFYFTLFDLMIGTFLSVIFRNKTHVNMWIQT